VVRRTHYFTSGPAFAEESLEEFAGLVSHHAAHHGHPVVEGEVEAGKLYTEPDFNKNRKPSSPSSTP